MMQAQQDLILVVDDSPETLGMLNYALEKSGMTTLVALEGNQAISIAEKMLPDLILLDAMMPELDGFDTCKALKASNTLRAIPIIFMTGLTDTESIVKGFEVGGIDYVTKPINPIELVARIKVHLANARTTLSAQTALDNAGQNICAVNSEGELQWATPQVSNLFKHPNQASWGKPVFRQTIADWIGREPPIDGILSHAKILGPLTFTYAGLSNNEEHLLRVSDVNQPEETDILKAHFDITTREAEVMLWVAKGKTNREIAQILELSPRTVNKHLEQLFRKIGVENRTSAAAMAVHYLQNKHGQARR